MNNQQRIEIIRDRLTKALNPNVLEIIDDSARHHGHAGAATGQGHFSIEISSPQFKDKSRVECHRLVYDALGTLMQTDIHALKIRII